MNGWMANKWQGDKLTSGMGGTGGQFRGDEYRFVTSVFVLFGNVQLGTFSPSWMKPDSSNILALFPISTNKLFHLPILSVFMKSSFLSSAPHKQEVKDRNMTPVTSHCWLWMSQRCKGCHIQIAPILRLILKMVPVYTVNASIQIN